MRKILFKCCWPYAPLLFNCAVIETTCDRFIGGLICHERNTVVHEMTVDTFLKTVHQYIEMVRNKSCRQTGSYFSASGPLWLSVQTKGMAKAVRKLVSPSLIYFDLTDNMNSLRSGSGVFEQCLLPYSRHLYLDVLISFYIVHKMLYLEPRSIWFCSQITLDNMSRLRSSKYHCSGANSNKLKVEESYMQKWRRMVTILTMTS